MVAHLHRRPPSEHDFATDDDDESATPNFDDDDGFAPNFDDNNDTTNHTNDEDDNIHDHSHNHTNHKSCLPYQEMTQMTKCEMMTCRHSGSETFRSVRQED